jgi:hypothetical protein
MLWSRGEARLARRPHISQRLTRRICWGLRCRKVEYRSHRSGDGEEPWGPRQICSRLRLVCKRPGAFPTCASIPRQRRSTSRSASSPAPGLPGRGCFVEVSPGPLLTAHNAPHSQQHLLRQPDLINDLPLLSVTDASRVEPIGELVF